MPLLLRVQDDFTGGPVDGAVYPKFLGGNLFLQIDGPMGREWVFQCDTEPKHSIKETKKHIKVMVRPGQSLQFESHFFKL